VKDPELGAQVRAHQNAVGSGLAPFDSWLLLRGLKTLAVRLERQQESATRLAQALAAHPRVSQVHHLSLTTHPGYHRHRTQASGPGAVICFETGSLERSERVVNETRLFANTVSFGSVSSTISLPHFMSHASIPPDAPAGRFPQDLVRVSVGLEHPDDLARDLTRALEADEAEPGANLVSRVAACARDRCGSLDTPERNRPRAPHLPAWRQ
jgi:cysteine-S-conjugate beta-lyase